MIPQLTGRSPPHQQQPGRPMQLSAMRAYAKRKGWQVSLKIEEVGSGATSRPCREELLRAARRKTIDIIVLWRLDRWGRSLVDLVTTLQELMVLKVGFVSLSEALDLTTPSGRASRPRQGGHCAGSQRRAAAWSPGDRRQKGA
jgi:putative DNA-invertase from lambdoid prophage Rac